MTSGFGSTTKKDLVVAEVLQKSLLALIELDRGKTDAALALLEQAAVTEESLPMEFGPPIIVKPSHELFGEVLLQLGRSDDAIVQFEKALARAPRRSLSLAGLARAAKAGGNNVVLARACEDLSSIYRRADDMVVAPDACSGNGPDTDGLAAARRGD